MYIFAFALPLVAFAAAMLCGADVEYWWAYLLVTAAAEGLLYLVFFFATRSKEYLSGYVTSVIHHFAWVERKEVKETVYGANGKTYTVKTKYVNHPDEYFWEFNTGLKAQIDSGLFYQMCQQWGTGTELIRVYHSHCVEGGDGEVCYWDGDEYNTQTVTYTHRYRNSVKNSHSVFRGQRVSRAEAKSLGLFKYPAISGFEQPVLLVSPGLDYAGDLDEANAELQILNAFCGSAKQIHVFVLLFPAAAGVEIALKQRDYWEGCNKNEFVVCLGMNGDRVEWCQTLSWMDEPVLDVEVKDYFLHHAQPQMDEFVRWLRNHLDLWKRKEFEDFKYLGWTMSHRGSVLFWVSALLLSLVAFLCDIAIGG